MGGKQGFAITKIKHIKNVIINSLYCFHTSNYSCFQTRSFVAFAEKEVKLS